MNFDGTNDEEKKRGQQFIDEISRGGLIRPTDLLNIAAAHANDLCRFITNNEEILKTLVNSVNSRTVFTKGFIDKLKTLSSTRKILDTTCSLGHKFAEYVSVHGLLYLQKI